VDTFGSWVAQLRKGVVELLVLELLRARGRMHGYAIVAALQEIGELVAGVSTVYPVLKRLESDGLVAADWDTSGGGNPRKYYEITPPGAQFLETARKEWQTLDDAMSGLRGDKR
jgi:PadR family transcriptional regulator PadR